MKSKSEINEIAYRIVGSAIEVHKELGPGLLENIYEESLVMELELNGLKVKRQLEVPVQYKGVPLKSNYRIDLLVEDLIIVELKAVEEISPVFQAQLLTYMKLLKKPKGLLINFNVGNITYEGLVPLVIEYFKQLPE
ncbi:MAG: GxxExxY protein [Saprospiraceae bacterium]|nr:GxxExxY protein [Saprospiraceae bacterium]